MTKLKEMRVKNGKSVRDIAKLLNITDMSIYHYENAKRKISISQLKQLAQYYNCNIDELID